MSTTTSEKNAAYYEQLYQSHADPWDYVQAAEQAKYRLSLEAARRWQPAPQRILEVACSLGYLTEQLAGYAPEVYAFDVSETAVRQTRQRCARLNTPTRFDIRPGDALEPDYPAGHFDVIFAGDVVHGAFDGSELSIRAVRALLPLLASGGVLVLTDYIQPADQAGYERLVVNQGAQVLEKLYFHDRYWFRLKNALKFMEKTRVAQWFLRSRAVYQFLKKPATWRGPQGSKHFGLVVQRKQ
ncbi:MAG: class I SAM-dependent methyltransferase [Cytophagaceae bacterium]|nr:class I SAM-dependent methyltransferase [Cytophagaceae bacterium]